MHHMCWLCYAAGDFSPNCPCDHRHEVLSSKLNASQPDEAEPQCGFCVEDPEDQQPDQNQHMQQVAEETMQSWRDTATEHGELRTMFEVGAPYMTVYDDSKVQCSDHRILTNLYMKVTLKVQCSDHRILTDLSTIYESLAWPVCVRNLT